MLTQLEIWKKLDLNNNSQCEMVLSEFIIRTDRKGMKNNVNELNKSIRSFAKEKNIYVIEHVGINEHHIAKKKLHLNAKGKSILELGFKEYLCKE